jgi:protein-S-isoprenylcysteine O-methyltransferase Ste14
MMATQELLVSGPFHYCRNPMSFGTILIYVGISLLIRSWSALGIAVIFSGLLIVYLKRIEEQELEIRFGEKYLEYKKKTSFLIPRFPPRRSD